MGSAQPRPQKQYAVEIKSDEEEKNQTGIYRHASCPDKLVGNFDEPIHSVYQMFKKTVEKNPDRNLFGKKVENEGQPAHYEWISYREEDILAQKTAKILQKFNIITDTKKYVALCAPICVEWLSADLAINMLGGTSVPFYQALSPQDVSYILEETEVTSLIGSRADILKLLKGGPECLASVKTFLVLDGID